MRGVISFHKKYFPKSINRTKITEIAKSEAVIEDDKKENLKRLRSSNGTKHDDDKTRT